VEREQSYLDELTARLGVVLGDELVGVYAGGSYALGGYVPPQSDLDVAVVVREPLSQGDAQQLVRAVRHESLPCPARKLELVVYTAAAARGVSVEADIELNLNTGEQEPLRAEAAPRAGEGHWFALDRSVLAAKGIALYGPPAAEVFRSPSREDLLSLLARVLRWYQEHEPGSEDALLNAGRALLFAREGAWVPKTAVSTWAQEADEGAVAGVIAEIEND
jgi:predicted nucleotidyltransferase